MALVLVVVLARRERDQDDARVTQSECEAGVFSACHVILHVVIRVLNNRRTA